MTPEDLAAWLVSMGYSRRRAAVELGSTKMSLGRWLAGQVPINHRVGLACAALSAGLQPHPDLRQWQRHLCYNNVVCAHLLGVDRVSYQRWLAREDETTRVVMLACSAIAAGLPPWQSNKVINHDL